MPSVLAAAAAGEDGVVWCGVSAPGMWVLLFRLDWDSIHIRERHQARTAFIVVALVPLVQLS